MRYEIKQKGFTLIEVMVAMVILAVGLLGMASLMARSQQSNESAYLRGQASAAAYDIIERMRTNLIDPTGTGKTSKVLYVTAQSTNAAKYAFTTLPSCAAPSGSAPASGASLAQYDLTDWCARLREAIPGIDSANTRIAVDTSELANIGVVSVTVTIQWSEKALNGTDSQSVVVETVL